MDSINKIIVDNCSSLATHRHGCCVLQKFLDGPYKKLKNDLIQSLVTNCLVLITDQFGNYVIQTVLLLNNKKTSSEIALKIASNVPYYSKHRYSSNVVEKCFDYCGEEEKRMFVNNLSSPEIFEELILDDHGNYVIQKALHYSEGKIKENMLKNIIPLIPKIKELSFGERLLSKLFATYPQLNVNSMYNFKNPNSYNNKDNNMNKNDINKKNNNGYYNNKFNDKEEDEEEEEEEERNDYKEDKEKNFDELNKNKNKKNFGNDAGNKKMK